MLAFIHGEFMKYVYGIGVNDVNYSVQLKTTIGRLNGKQQTKLIWICPFYSCWKGMLQRCYSDKYKSKWKTYVNCSVDERFHRLTTFKFWMEQQSWEGKHLDKDIIIPNNKLYSPETCAFVLPRTNTFICDRSNGRGNLPVGVTKSSNSTYRSRCNDPFSNSEQWLGTFATKGEAHEAWRKRKHELAQLVAETESDPRVVEALKKRYSVEEWYKHNPNDVSF